MSFHFFSALQLNSFNIDEIQSNCAYLFIYIKEAKAKRCRHLPWQLKSVLQVVKLVTGQPSRVLNDKKQKTLSQREIKIRGEKRQKSLRKRDPAHSKLIKLDVRPVPRS